jgi:S-adenosylmethionine:tRNA ribosyltransferase-isomerase
LDNPERYQTVVAKIGGSAAAPTAGLHFTKGLLAHLKQLGVEIATVTLDVGIDTFRPVHTEALDEHEMHGERCDVSQDTADKVAACPGRVIAVGTTTVRTLESHASGPRKVETGSQLTRIFIRPGYRFQVVDGMFTNFHLPRTTMLVMLSAIVGRDRLMSAYAEAIQQNYRFLSFGDSMLIL